MKLTQIMALVNTKLAGETLTYKQAQPYLDACVCDINTHLNACFPMFSDVHPNLVQDTSYDAIPDMYIVSVIVPGTAFKFYTTDEEGISTAQAYQQEYERGLFYMVRDYSEAVPDEYKASGRGYVEGPAPSIAQFKSESCSAAGLNPDIRYVEGPQGPQGPQGPIGPQGPQGLVGKQGIQGPQGPQGYKGDKGDKGDKGPKGDLGEPGYTPRKGVDYFTEEDIKALGVACLQYYGDANIVPSDASLFTFTTNDATMTASVGATSTDISGDVVIPYEYVIDGKVYSVTEIKMRGFEGCTGLTSVIIPNSITRISPYAFNGCTNLTRITIPNSVTNIGSGLFERCTNLTSITIPNRVTVIYDSTFNYCSSLTNTTIPSGVTSIGASAFGRCINLTSITIPNSVTSIKQSAFLESDKLSDIYYEGTKEQWDNITIEERNNSCLLNATIHYGYINEQENIVVDTEMSDESENAVQNKVIKKYVDDKTADIYEDVESIGISVSHKEDITQVYNIDDADFLYFSGDNHNADVRMGEASSITLIISNGVYPENYISGLSFDSGETPTAIDYTSSNIINWVGTDCTTVDGLSIFQPSANTHYDIVFYFNGTQFIGLVNGFVPATGNVVSE